MLGGLLTQQAEEEEEEERRQLLRLEAAEQQQPQPQPQHELEENRNVSATTVTITAVVQEGVTASSSAASSPHPRRHEDVLHPSDLEGDDSSLFAKDDDDDDDDDDMGGASEEEEEEDDDDDDIESSYSEDDDDDNGSSSTEHDANEGTYLLGGSEWIKQRRRRRRRHHHRRRLGDDDDDGSREMAEPTTTFIRYKTILKNWKRSIHKLQSKIRLAVSAIADVENLWDSPDDNSDQHHNNILFARHRRYYGGVDSRSAINANNNNLHTHYGAGSSTGNNMHNHQHTSTITTNDNRASTMIYNIIAGGTMTRNRTAAIVWFVLLSSSYAFERSTFKLLVDRVGPFRLFAAELILGTHALLTALGMAMGRLYLRNSKDKRDIDTNVLMAEMRMGAGGGSGMFSGLPLADVACKFHLSVLVLLLLPSSSRLLSTKFCIDF